MSSRPRFPSLVENPTVSHYDRRLTKSSFDFGTALQNVYPLLRLVFKHLRYEDLEAAALVSPAWNKYACEEMQTRSNFSWACSVRNEKGVNSVELSNNYRYGSAAFTFLFYNCDIKLTTRVVVEGKDKTRQSCCK